MRTNIIRITAFILALAIILVCGVSLVAGTTREPSQEEQPETEALANAQAAVSARRGDVKNAADPVPAGKTAQTAARSADPQTSYTAKTRARDGGTRDELPVSAAARDKASAGAAELSPPDDGYLAEDPTVAGETAPRTAEKAAGAAGTPDASDETAAPEQPTAGGTSALSRDGTETGDAVPDKAVPDAAASAADAETVQSDAEEDRYDALTLSEDDLELLARLVYLEARGEPYDGQVAVAEVVLNRVVSDRFPDTVEEVIYQTGQFTPASYIESTTPGEEQYEAVADAVDGETCVTGEDVVFFSGAPYNDRVYAVIGNHYFCEL